MNKKLLSLYSLKFNPFSPEVPTSALCGALRRSRASAGASNSKSAKAVSPWLYMRRRGAQLTLSTEHRAAPSQDHIPLQLTQAGLALALSVASDSSIPEPNSEPSALQRVQQVLAGLDQPVTVLQLRKLCGMRTTTVCSCLAQLADNGVLSHDSRGYQLKLPLQSPAVSLSSPIDPQGNGNGKYSP